MSPVARATIQSRLRSPPLRGQRLDAGHLAMGSGRHWLAALAFLGASTVLWADAGPRTLAAIPAPLLASAQASLWQVPTTAAAEKASIALDRPIDDPVTVRLAPGGEQQSPSSCRALLAVQAHIIGTRPAGDWDVLQRRLADCEALWWWSQVKSPASTSLGGLPAAAQATKLWPAQLWPAVSDDEQQTRQRPGQTLQRLSGQTHWRVQAPGRLASAGASTGVGLQAGLLTWSLQARGYTVELQWLAHGDFDGDGWEDWLLRWQAQATDGRWRTVRSLLLSQAAGEARFRVEAKPSMPR